MRPCLALSILLIGVALVERAWAVRPDHFRHARDPLQQKVNSANTRVIARGESTFTRAARAEFFTGGLTALADSLTRFNRQPARGLISMRDEFVLRAASPITLIDPVAAKSSPRFYRAVSR